MMNPNEYFPEQYLQDHKLYSDNVDGDLHICGRLLYSFFKKVDCNDLIDGTNLFICQYELNLIGQVIHSHFSDDFDLWKSLVPAYADCRCTYSSHPLEILRFVESESKDYCNIVFTYDDILTWDIFFLEYMKSLCKDNTFQYLTVERLVEAIKKDPDCNSNYVKNYFERKKNRRRSDRSSNKNI